MILEFIISTIAYTYIILIMRRNHTSAAFSFVAIRIAISNLGLPCPFVKYLSRTRAVHALRRCVNARAHVSKTDVQPRAILLP